ncbi:energy transducer TonB [Dyella sp.]|uniref:energy transducer TonB n=1 Tax=Dyella sp. TaxID=1869338 RepID=UPI002D7779CA|nr:energy transducer TonB [Dyella sp.]HET7331198.1 energy transducer TonB [Dyella sp.]
MALVLVLTACAGAPAQQTDSRAGVRNAATQQPVSTTGGTTAPFDMIGTINAYSLRTAQSEGRPPVDPPPSRTAASFRHKQLPVYPEPALKHHHQGTVMLRILVGRDGKPQQVVMDHSSSYKSLDIAARKATQGWKFNPATRNGIPVETWQRVPVYFQNGGVGVGRPEIIR